MYKGVYLVHAVCPPMSNCLNTEYLFYDMSNTHNVVIHNELSELTRKVEQYKINDLCLYQPGFYESEMSDFRARRTVHKFLTVVHVLSTS